MKTHARYNRLLKSVLMLGIAMAWAAPASGATATPPPTQTPYVIVVTATPAAPTTEATLPPLPKAATATLRVSATLRSVPTATIRPTSTPQFARTRVPQATISATTTTTPAISASPKVTLPIAMTATPAPLVAVSVVLTDAEATQLAVESMLQQGLPVDNLQVSFSKEVMRITGDVNGGGTIIRTASGQLVVIGVPVVENESLHFQLSSMTLNGRRLSSYRREMVNAIDDVFRRRFLGQRVQSAVLEEGKLNVVVLSKPE